VMYLTLESSKGVEISIFTGLCFVDPAWISKNGGIFLMCGIKRDKRVEVIKLSR
jgi:hypothetical protein